MKLGQIINENMLFVGRWTFFCFEIHDLSVRQISTSEGIKMAKDKSDQPLFIVYSTSQCLLTRLKESKPAYPKWK